jgi:hypothetical protein
MGFLFLLCSGAWRFGGRDFTERDEEGFGFGLRADGDAHEIRHGGERAADEDVARAKLFDYGFYVRAHVEHDEISL